MIYLSTFANIKINILYLIMSIPYSFFFFFNDTATTEIYTLSLHDALPISNRLARLSTNPGTVCGSASMISRKPSSRSEEHTSELQSRLHLVCRLLLEKKKKKKKNKILSHKKQST